ETPFPLRPNSTDLLEMGLTGILAFGTLPLPPSFRLPPVFQTPDRWRGYLMRQQTGSSPLIPPGFLMQERRPPPISATDLFRLPQPAVQESLEATCSGGRPPGISANDPEWVAPVLPFLGRLLASADIVLGGVPANAGADGIFRDADTGEVVIGSA